MNTLPQFGVLVGLTWLAAAGTWLVQGPPERKFVCERATLKPGEVCLEDLASDSSLLWVDARSREQWQRDGIAGSILWNLDSSEDMHVFEAEAAPRILEAGKVVVYCDNVDCGTSHQIAERIRKLDLGAEVVVLRGGWQALMEAGRIKGSNPAP